LELFSGDIGKGVKFADDPVIRSKFLFIPSLKMAVTLEGVRFRVDGENDFEPKDSQIVKEGLRIFNKIFSANPLLGYGFNFDIYYRFNQIIPLDFLFEKFVYPEPSDKKSLRNMGIQFTLSKNPNLVETYFVKITAPLEIVVHANFHFNNRIIPSEADLQKLFEKKYDEVDLMVNRFKF